MLIIFFLFFFQKCDANGAMNADSRLDQLPSYPSLGQLNNNYLSPNSNGN